MAERAGPLMEGVEVDTQVQLSSTQQALSCLFTQKWQRRKYDVKRIEFITRNNLNAKRLECDSS